MDSLWIPFTFNNGISTRNRIALSPLTNTQSHIDGTLAKEESQWLLRQAHGGFGLLLTCAAYIHPTAKAWQGQLGIHSTEQVLSLKPLTNALRQAGSVNIMQIFHGGARCPSALTGVQPVSASAFTFNAPDFEQPRAMSIDEIEQTTEAFVHAAKQAYDAGFDGVELHGANGYLITQFISTDTNFREDAYGGSLENRARFVRELVRACRQSLPASFLIGIRILAEGSGLDLDENVRMAAWLVEDGIDYLSISAVNALAAPQKYASTCPEQYTVSYFRAKLGSDFPIVAGGGIQLRESAERLIAQGATWVTLGRAAIGNPTWPKDIVNANYMPVLLPYSEDYLRKSGISDTFIRYLRKMPKGFVLNE